MQAIELTLSSPGKYLQMQITFIKAAMDEFRNCKHPQEEHMV